VYKNDLWQSFSRVSQRVQVFSGWMLGNKVSGAVGPAPLSHARKLRRVRLAKIQCGIPQVDVLAGKVWRWDLTFRSLKLILSALSDLIRKVAFSASCVLPFVAKPTEEKAM